jgi:hypothetical protein
MVFYVARRTDLSGQSIRFACMGLAWALSTVALFSVISSRGISPRLRLAGHGSGSLFLGRLLALEVAALVVGGAYAVVVVVDQELVAAWAVVAALLLSAALSVALGMVVGAVSPRDLEGMLVLIMVVGLQMIIDPAQSVARVLPLWSTRELLTYGVTGEGDLAAAWLHAGAYGAALVVLGLVLTGVRLRRRRHLVVEPQAAGAARRGVAPS